MQETIKAHVFSHLGKAPYKFLGFEQKTFQACPGAPIKVGGSCDHCGTGIIDMFRFESVDGKQFKVGSSCVLKSGDTGLRRQVNRIKKEQKRKKDEARISAAVELLDDSFKSYLSSFPHLMRFTDRWTGKALTELDWVEWMLEHSGNAGKLRVARHLEKRKKNI